MIAGRSIGLCVFINLALLCRGGYRRPSDGFGFGFPESEEDDPSKKNAQNKGPVSIPNKCKEGELLYPGDQDDDWVCDCKPAYIFYPPTQQCYPAYRKGPCRDDEYLILTNNSVIPECTSNPCKQDNYVPFKNRCCELDKPGPCPYPELPNVVAVNETTLEIGCTNGFTRAEVLSRLANDRRFVGRMGE